MKKWLAALLLLPLLMVAGCEPFESADDDAKVEFINRSDSTVTVIPQARSGWDGFKLAPGERRTFNELYDVFFTYEPRFRVTVGDNADGRVVFVNNAGAETIE